MEHLTFTGSEQYPYKGILDRIANRCFAQGTNAMTDVDNTCYTLEVAGIEGFLNILPIYINHILYPTLTEDAFITEIHSINGDGEDEGVVYSEMESCQNTYCEVMHRMICHQLFGDSGYYMERFLHSYSSYFGGAIENLRELTVDKIRAFHREFYRPENLSIYVCGNWGDDDSILLNTLLAVEDTIVEKRLVNPPPPYERPWVYHTNTITAGDPSHPYEVLFPSSDVDNNNYYVALAFKTTSIQDLRTNNLIELLLCYLTDSKNSTFTKYFVYDAKLCGDVSYQRFSNSIEAFYLLFSNVNKKDIHSIQPAFNQLIEQILNEGINLTRLRDTITIKLKEYSMMLEKDIANEYLDAVALHFLYDDHTGDDHEFNALIQRANYASFLKELLDSMPSQEFWKSLISQYFCPEKNAIFTIIGIPSIERADEIAKEEHAIVEKRMNELGSEVLEEYDIRNEEAQEANDKPIPPEVIERIPIPSIHNVCLRDYCACILENGKITACEPSPASSSIANQLLQQANEVLKSNPLYPIQLIHYNTHFTTYTAVLSLTNCTERELILLPTLLECIMDAPQIVDGKTISSEEIIDIHYRDTVSLKSRIGLPGDSRTFAAGLECCSFRVIVEGNQLEKGLSLLHNLLVHSYFTKECVEKVLVCNDKLLDEQNHDSDNIAVVLTRRMLLNQASAYLHAYDTIEQKKLGEYYLEHPEEYPSLLTEFETLRNKLIRPECIHLSIASNFIQYPLNSTLLFSYPLYKQVVIQPTSFNIQSIQFSYLFSLPSPCQQGVICGMKDATTVSAYFMLPCDSYMSFHERIILFVTKELLSGFEGPLWRAIRGKGLSYDFGIVRSAETHYICFYLNDCSSPVESFEATASIIQEYTTTCSELELNSAKGSSYYKICSSMDGPATDVMFRFIQQRALNYSKLMLDEIEKITLEEVKECIQKVFTQLVSTESTFMVLTCSDEKVEEYKEEFGKIGYQMEEKQFEML